MSHSSAWFPCYVNDLLGSMRWKMMTPAERGAYWQLICWQMQSEDGTLADDVPALSRLADLSLTDHPTVLDAFPVIDGGRRANPRALTEWRKRMAISGQRAAAGSKGMARRWHDDGLQNDNKRDNKRHNKPITNDTTTTTTSTSTATSTTTEEGVKGDVGLTAPPAKPEKPPKKPRPLAMPDEAWIASMVALYQPLGVRVQHEIGRAQAWAATKGRKATRRFVSNWLNRAARDDSTLARSTGATAQITQHAAGEY